MARNSAPSRARPIRVAIVGGGCAAVTAAFELSRPEHRGRFRIDLYQEGWRLGGKGASGRGRCGRIEEHGLHLWMGYYENAFRLLRECYRELDRDPRRYPIAHWRDALFPSPQVGLAEPQSDGSWQTWMALFPPEEGLPGDQTFQPQSLIGYLRRCLTLLRTLLVSAAPQGFREHSGDVEARPESQARRLLQYGRLATLGGLVEATRVVETVCASLPRPPRWDLPSFLESVASGARHWFQERIDTDAEIRRIWVLVDLLLTLVRGCVTEDLLTDPRGLDAIEDWDLCDWLRLHGAAETTLESGFVRGLYSLTFAFEAGDPEYPRLAATAGVRGFLRMFFDYRGSLFWKMRAGMGDVVFAPFFEVLQRRGVRIHFFHRLDRVRIAPPGPRGQSHVTSLELLRQAALAGERYDPLIHVRGLPCWPAAPLYEQLADGERLRAVGWNPESMGASDQGERVALRVGKDFDLVVLGVGLGEIPRVCGDILAVDARWRTMVRHVQTVATQAFQLWLREDLEQLGWTEGPVNLTAFVRSFDTWATMDHLIPWENWPQPPAAIAYFCNTLPERWAQVPEKEAMEQVRREAFGFLRHDLPHLWPGAVDSRGEFRWSILEAPAEPDEPPTGEARFDQQFRCANVRPTDRYVQAAPGTARFRISPLETTYDNLTLAGDWTNCGLNYGCVEAAVISGRLAACALSGSPRPEDIPGFDHP